MSKQLSELQYIVKVHIRKYTYYIRLWVSNFGLSFDRLFEGYLLFDLVFEALTVDFRFDPGHCSKYVCDTPCEANKTILQHATWVSM